MRLDLSVAIFGLLVVSQDTESTAASETHAVAAIGDGVSGLSEESLRDFTSAGCPLASIYHAGKAILG